MENRITMKKKILFIITRSVKGGAQKHLYDLIRLLDRERYSIDVLCAPGGPLTEQLKEIGINLFPVPQLRNEIHPIRDAIAFIK
ncbi:MAG: glycosyltransferase family 1 protein, partial [Nitrospirota bacterium]